MFLKCAVRYYFSPHRLNLGWNKLCDMSSLCESLKLLLEDLYEPMEMSGAWA